MKYVALFHANLNYAFLIPQNYERVIRASYEVIIDTFADKHPNAKYVFEASGYTIEQMAKVTPDVLEKLKAAIERGQCEFMGAPYSHPIMANIPEEDGRWSCQFAMKASEKHLGMTPVSFWNPECTWMQYVPKAFRDAGVKNLTLDFESYMNCNDKDYAWIERNRCFDMSWGGHLPWFDLDPDCKFLHRPFKDVVPGLNGMCRSDRLVGKYLSYFRGTSTVDDYIENVKYWSGTKDEGATIIIADDAEYCGTTGYYYVKYHDDYSRSFDLDPTAAEKLDILIARVCEIGEMITFDQACQEKPVEEPYFVEDRFAWHRTYATAWGGTPEARRYEPIVNNLREDYKKNVQPITEAPDADEKYKPLVEKFWFHCTNSSNSDACWPPPPGRTCKFNREWVEQEIESTKQALAEIKQAIEGETLPEIEEAKDNAQADGVYGHVFTEKDVTIPAKLNNYELQHAIYHAHKMADSKRPEIAEEGRALLKRVFDELDARGMKGIRPVAIR